MKRAEAAAVLERRMAAMEAAMAARRTPVAEAQPQAARGPGADLRFQVLYLVLLVTSARELLSRTLLVLLQMGGATSSGPAAGTGYEIILQAFNWESHKEEWYKARPCGTKLVA